MTGPCGGFNRNVLLNLLAAAIGGVADSVWTGPMLTVFLSDITNNSNTKIGLITALQGGTELITALPTGNWIAKLLAA